MSKLKKIINHRDTEGTEILNELSSIIIGSAIEVHKALGPGLLESLYEEAMICELNLQGLSVVSQVEIPVTYKGQVLKNNYRMDLLVESSVIVEIKAASELTAIHDAQLLTYLKLTRLRLGLLLNFNVPVLKDGIRRILHG